MTIEQNKVIMQRMIEEIWNKGNLAVADELFSTRAHQPQRTGSSQRCRKA